LLASERFWALRRCSGIQEAEPSEPSMQAAAAVLSSSSRDARSLAAARPDPGRHLAGLRLARRRRSPATVAAAPPPTSQAEQAGLASADECRCLTEAVRANLPEVCLWRQGQEQAGHALQAETRIKMVRSPCSLQFPREIVPQDGRPE
jgi:hypothetical protein